MCSKKNALFGHFCGLSQILFVIYNVNTNVTVGHLFKFTIAGIKSAELL